MNGTEIVPVRRHRLGLLLWSAGTLGAVTVAVGVLPRLATTLPTPVPLWLLMLASTLQSAVLVGLAVWGGVALAPAVGLRAPAFEAAASGRPILPVLRPQVLPGMVAGVLGGPLLFFSLRWSPAAIAELQDRYTPPLYARVLYGGITEEVLLRWGVMTALAWLAWRLVQRRRGTVKPTLVWAAILLSALMFGVGHLPMAAHLVGSLDGPLVLFVVGLNTVFGVMFGWLFWRRGLESAMIAHAVTHLVSYAITEWSRS